MALLIQSGFNDPKIREYQNKVKSEEAETVKWTIGAGLIGILGLLFLAVKMPGYLLIFSSLGFIGGIILFFHEDEKKLGIGCSVVSIFIMGWSHSRMEYKDAVEKYGLKIVSEIGPQPTTSDLYKFENAIKAKINDPESLKIDSSSFEAKLSSNQCDGSKCWFALFEFRAKNGFGALVKNTAYAWYLNDGVFSLTIIPSH